MEAPRKRQRPEDEVDRIVTEALEKLSQIDGLNTKDFGVPGRKTKSLPLAGFGDVRRPPEVFDFIGRPMFGDIIRKIGSGTKRFILTGAKGVGKSCILRAFACVLCTTRACCKRTGRILCFWYFDAAGNLAKQVQEALLFAFCEEPELKEVIASISTYQDAAAFLRSRKVLGEDIWLITDGEERLDPDEKSAAKSCREAARKWLVEIGREAKFIVKALSPNARELKESRFQGSPFIYTLDKVFGQEEYMAYIEGTVLGEMLQIRPERKDEVDFLAGRHPQSLYALLNCCRSRAGTPLDERLTKCLERIGEGIATSSVDSSLLDNIVDDEDWQQVVEDFTESFRKELLTAVDNASLKVESLAEVSTKHTAYVVAGDFCTPFIRQVYIEAAFNVMSGSYKCSEWTSYAKLRLRDARGLNWAELGWLCENLVSDLVKAGGLKLTGLQEDKVVSTIKGLPVRRLRGGDPEEIETGNWKDGEGLILLPDKFWFKYVDFVVLVKLDGELHLIGGQSTMNPDNHRGTERKFMRRRNIVQWIGEGVQCTAHYAYLCPERRATNLPELGYMAWTGKEWVQVDKGKDWEEKHKQPRGEASEDEGVSYVLHVAGFTECFPKIGIEEKAVLTELATERDKAVLEKKAAKNANSQARFAAMDAEVRKYVRSSCKAYLEAKARVHGIVGASTKERLVKALIDRQVMVGCGGSGKECSLCIEAREWTSRSSRSKQVMAGR